MTTPTPSLNRLSPATVASSAGETFARLSTPITDTGSVGLISAPNTKHQIAGTSKPIARDSSRNPPPISAVDSATPIVLSTRIGQRPRRISLQSTWSAPANSRNDSIPSISVVWKSMPGDETHDVAREVGARQDPVDRDDEQRGDRPHDRQPDRRRQLEEAVIHIAKHGGEHDQDRCRVERGEREAADQRASPGGSVSANRCPAAGAGAARMPCVAKASRDRARPTFGQARPRRRIAGRQARHRERGHVPAPRRPGRGQHRRAPGSRRAYRRCRRTRSPAAAPCGGTIATAPAFRFGCGARLQGAIGCYRRPGQRHRGGRRPAMIAVDRHVVSRHASDKGDHSGQRRRPLRLDVRLVARLSQFLALGIERAGTGLEQDLIDVEPYRPAKRILDRPFAAAPSSASGRAA